MPPSIREATVDDVPRALDTLTAAFHDYPQTRHLLAADRHRERVREFHELFLVDIGMRHGRVWLADDADAVAIWTTPDFTDAPEVFAALAPRMAEICGDRADASAAAAAALAPYRPVDPAWFLATVGVRPDRQGHGLARAVLTPGLREADADGTVAYLETSTESNVELYRRFGFVVDAEIVLPDNGPSTWAMTRPVGG